MFSLLFQPKNYGFRCLVVGYERNSKSTGGLRNLELELSYLGGTCAASLMKKNIPVNPVNNSAATSASEAGGHEDMDIVNDAADEAYEMHSSLLSKGFALERPPSVNEAIGASADGGIPFRCVRTGLLNFLV